MAKDRENNETHAPAKKRGRPLKKARQIEDVGKRNETT
jgi:hypothetical protein